MQLSRVYVSIILCAVTLSLSYSYIGVMLVEQPPSFHVVTEITSDTKYKMLLVSMTSVEVLKMLY